MYTLKTLISWGVPAVVRGRRRVLRLRVVTQGEGRRRRKAERSRRRPTHLGGGAAAAPTPFAVKRLNDKLDSVRVRVRGRDGSPESAERAKARRAFDDKYAATLGKPPPARSSPPRSAAREDAGAAPQVAAAARARAQAVTKAGKKGGDFPRRTPRRTPRWRRLSRSSTWTSAEDHEERAAARAHVVAGDAGGRRRT